MYQFKLSDLTWAKFTSKVLISICIVWCCMTHHTMFFCHVFCYLAFRSAHDKDHIRHPIKAMLHVCSEPDVLI